MLILTKEKNGKEWQNKLLVLLPNWALVTMRHSFFMVAGIPAFLRWGDTAMEGA
jgi:hypothetical protein